MISCKRAAELISKSMDEPLSVGEGLSLKVHLFICEMCEQFRHHLNAVRKGLRSEDEDKVGSHDGHGSCTHDVKEALSRDAKERIKKSLDTDGH